MFVQFCFEIYMSVLDAIIIRLSSYGIILKSYILLNDLKYTYLYPCT